MKNVHVETGTKI